MVGSASSIADANTVLNTIVADELEQFADRLEKADDFNAELDRLIKSTVAEHSRVIFNGDGYSKEWEDEAERRGLPNLKTTVDCLPWLLKREYVDVFTRHNVYTESEITSRYEIELENYIKHINIEARTFVDVARQEVIPAVVTYLGEISHLAADKAGIGCDVSFEKSVIEGLSRRVGELKVNVDTLADDIAAEDDVADSLEKATYCRDVLIAHMDNARSVADELETLTAKKYWPFPTYSELLFSL